MTNFGRYPIIDKLRDHRLNENQDGNRHCHHTKYISEPTENKRVEDSGSSAYGKTSVFVDLTAYTDLVNQLFEKRVSLPNRCKQWKAQISDG